MMPSLLPAARLVIVGWWVLSCVAGCGDNAPSSRTDDVAEGSVGLPVTPQAHGSAVYGNPVMHALEGSACLLVRFQPGRQHEGQVMVADMSRLTLVDASVATEPTWLVRVGEVEHYLLVPSDPQQCELVAIGGDATATPLDLPGGVVKIAPSGQAVVTASAPSSSAPTYQLYDLTSDHRVEISPADHRIDSEMGVAINDKYLFITGQRHRAHEFDFTVVLQAWSLDDGSLMWEVQGEREDFGLRPPLVFGDVVLAYVSDAGWQIFAQDNGAVLATFVPERHRSQIMQPRQWLGADDGSAKAYWAEVGLGAWRIRVHDARSGPRLALPGVGGTDLRWFSLVDDPQHGRRLILSHQRPQATDQQVFIYSQANADAAWVLQQDFHIDAPAHMGWVVDRKLTWVKGDQLHWRSID